MKSVSAAFVKAKREFGPALKNSVNPHLKNKYADLGSCLDAVTDALLNNGIAMYQETSEDATGVTVETVFLHESGESLRCGKMHVPAPKNDPQGYGSALTYARRYSLVTSCGIAQEDDDGHAGSRKPDAAAILRSISGSATLDILRGNFESAMSMLDEVHHVAIKKAANARKHELTPKKEEA